MRTHLFRYAQKPTPRILFESNLERLPLNLNPFSLKDLFLYIPSLAAGSSPPPPLRISRTHVSLPSVFTDPIPTRLLTRSTKRSKKSNFVQKSQTNFKAGCPGSKPPV